jgi:type IV secretion system protein VirB10
MRQDTNKLSPDSSPNTLNHADVKKVNNVPLFIVCGIAILFALLIAMVAIKKSTIHQSSAHQNKLAASKNDTLRLANEVIKNNHRIVRGSKTVLLPIKTELPTHVNLPKVPAPELLVVHSDISDSELERIRQEKTQAFEEAVKSKVTISVDKELLKQGSQTNSYNRIQMQSPNQSLSFKEQLKIMQSAQQTTQTARQIGGEEDDKRWHLNTKLQNPTTPFELRAGAVIPGILISGIRSEIHGQIIGQVSQDVYDTATGNHLLIPQGTKLLGVYSSDITFGQDSVLVAWQRLVFPDGKALDIGAMSGSDSAGYAGFRDEVDHHYARIYGSAILMSGIVAAISYSQNQNGQGSFSAPTAGNVLSQSLGQQLGQTTSQLIAKNINTAPTINIRPGYEFNVTVTKDLVFITLASKSY